MPFLADLHIHSRYSRATSRAIDPLTLAVWARKKGISVLGTGDFTHPAWLSELRDALTEAEEGLFALVPELQAQADAQIPHTCRGDVRFLLSSEISCIYKKGGKTRKIHHLVLMPGFDAADRLRKRLSRIGNLTSDGRPILGLDSHDLLEMVLESGPGAFLIPAHIWTPWFSLFGSRSGFEAVEACYGDLTPHIRALETGLSSDPPMNRTLSCLDPYVLVSHSDAHSPSKLGREANLFETPMDYPSMLRAMGTGEGFGGTVEFFPEEGKYHLDGHRRCGIRVDPFASKGPLGPCPVCGKPLTEGVLSRVHTLADRSSPVLDKPFFPIIPLGEILSEILGCRASSQKVATAYEEVLRALGPELPLLLWAPLEALATVGGILLSSAVERMRENRVFRDAGYDGEYGSIRLFAEGEQKALLGQQGLFGKGPLPSLPGPAAKAPRQMPPKQTGPPLPSERQEHAAPGDGLNPEQARAAGEEARFVLVRAGPGTGKTLTLTHRMARLLSDGRARPGDLLALTFTRKAARELVERLCILVPDLERRALSVETFHAFCLRILREWPLAAGVPPDFSLCHEQDALRLLEETAAASGIRDLPRLRSLAGKLSHMRRAWALGASREAFPVGLAAVAEAYLGRLREAKLLDLDALELEAFRLLGKHPEVSRTLAERTPFLFVDEYQDTNPVQVAILKYLVASGTNRLFAIGDPDQAIYGFRGADVEGFHRFLQDFPGAVVRSLLTNYRSAQRILDASAHLMASPAPLRAMSLEEGHLLMAQAGTDAEEAETLVSEIERLLGGTRLFSMDSGRVAPHEGSDTLGFGDIAVLFRLNRQGDALETALSRAGIPVARSGDTSLVGRFPVSVLYRFLQVRQDPGNPTCFARYREAVTEGLPLFRPDPAHFSYGRLPVGEELRRALEIHGLLPLSSGEKALLQRLEDLAEPCGADLRAFLDRLALERGIDGEALPGDRVPLLSIHAAKGLEWPVVFVTGCEDGLLPCTLFGTGSLEEERRLFYVAMTRARSRLILSHARTRTLNGRVLRLARSPFLDALPGHLWTPLDRAGWKPHSPGPRQLSLF